MSEKEDLVVGTTTVETDRPGTTFRDIENACMDIVQAHPEPALQALLVHPADWPSIDKVLEKSEHPVALGGLPVYIWKDGDEAMLKMFDGQVPEPGKVIAKYHTAHLRIAADIVKRRLEGG